MSEIQYNQKSLSKTTSELNVEYDGELISILSDKEKVEKLYNVLGHIIGELHTAKTELEILKQHPSISAIQQSKIETARNILNDILGEDVIVDYNNVDDDNVIINTNVVDDSVIDRMVNRVKFEQNGGIFEYINLFNQGYSNEKIAQKYGFSDSTKLLQHIGGVYWSVNNARGKITEIIRYYQKNIKHQIPMLHFLMKCSYYDSNNFMSFDDIYDVYVDYCRQNDFIKMPLVKRSISVGLKGLYGSKVITSRGGKKFFNVGFKINISKSDDSVIMPSLNNVNNLTINDNIDDLIVSDDLSFIDPEELYAYLKCKGIVFGKYTYQRNKNYLKTFAPDHYCKNKYYNFALGKLPNDVSISDIMSELTTNSSKMKLKIDNIGGIKTLYKFAKKRLSASYISHDIVGSSCKWDGANVGRYVRFYGFDGWSDFCNFVNSFDDWDCCKQALIVKRNDSINEEI